jgi:3-deoxy-D-manno-octulosonic-acid transferase
MLTKVYSYADLAYVGGGFATGLHNTLEPAVFGIPVITGPQYQGFREAEDLVNLGGISIVTAGEDFSKRVMELIENKEERKQQGKINLQYVAARKGATQKIMTHITRKLKV